MGDYLFGLQISKAGTGSGRWRGRQEAPLQTGGPFCQEHPTLSFPFPTLYVCTYFSETVAFAETILIDIEAIGSLSGESSGKSRVWCW